MPTLAITNFNIVCSVLGGFITIFGLVSYLFKEKFYLSEARKSSSPFSSLIEGCTTWLPRCEAWICADSCEQ